MLGGLESCFRDPMRTFRENRNKSTNKPKLIRNLKTFSLVTKGEELN